LRVLSLHIYPVKALRGIDLAESAAEGRGLALDRRWMLVDGNGRFISQREHPKLAAVTAAPETDGLRLAYGTSEIRVPLPPTAAMRLPVTLWKQGIEGYAAAAEADDWFSGIIGMPCRLVYQGGLPRPVATQYAPAGAEASYADGFPLLVTLKESLDDLNSRMAAPLPMNRFRPNIVIEGAPAWSEDGWKRLRIGAVVLDLVKPCTRCVVTTTDQQSGERQGSEPLHTLKQFRFMRAPGLAGVAFGQNALVVAAGRLRQGDPVEILETQAPPAFAA
jgi:uncharacterized protein